MNSCEKKKEDHRAQRKSVRRPTGKDRDWACRPVSVESLRVRQDLLLLSVCCSCVRYESTTEKEKELHAPFQHIFFYRLDMS